MSKTKIRRLTIGVGDIEPILLVVGSYRSYLRATGATNNRHRLQRLDALHQRVQRLLLRCRNGEMPATLPLTTEDWRVLHGALQGWVAVLRQTFPPSVERESVIESTLAFARDVESMLSP